VNDLLKLACRLLSNPYEVTNGSAVDRLTVRAPSAYPAAASR